MGSRIDPAVDPQLVSWTETIRCPACGLVQPAEVWASDPPSDLFPRPSYVHDCVGPGCGRLILEADWDPVPNPLAAARELLLPHAHRRDCDLVRLGDLRRDLERMERGEVKR